MNGLNNTRSIKDMVKDNQKVAFQFYRDGQVGGRLDDSQWNGRRQYDQRTGRRCAGPGSHGYHGSLFRVWPSVIAGKHSS
jgi:hypothetical protein